MPSSSLRIVLVAPRIAENVASIVRTTYSLNAELHLVGPFGFRIDPSRLKRSSVGYWEELKPVIYKDFEEFWGQFSIKPETEFYFATKRGDQIYTSMSFGSDVVLIFGNEEEGVPGKFWEFTDLDRIKSCRIPTQNVRCLNLGVSVAIIGFEVARQWDSESKIRQFKEK